MWPEGLAQRIPAGADIVLNSHLFPVGKPAVERTAVGLYFGETPSTREVVYLSLPPSFGAYAEIDIPPGAMDYRVTDSFVLPVDTLATSSSPTPTTSARSSVSRRRCPTASAARCSGSTTGASSGRRATSR